MGERRFCKPNVIRSTAASGGRASYQDESPPIEKQPSRQSDMRVSNVTTVYSSCDYVILRLAGGGVCLNFLKLHKLLYYCQAWNLAFGRGRLFPSQFQAWIHGPVSRQIYDRYFNISMYSSVSAEDASHGFDARTIDSDDRRIIDSVLESYAALAGDQLEEMTHREDPWVAARQGISPSERSENVISEELMQRYYGARL